MLEIPEQVVGQMARFGGVLPGRVLSLFARKMQTEARRVSGPKPTAAVAAVNTVAPV